MFDYRAGIYLILIVWILQIIFLGGEDGLKDVCFRKNNDSQRLIVYMMYVVVITFFSVIAISEIPLVINLLHTKESGVIKEFVFTDPARRISEPEKYIIVLQNTIDGSTKEYKDVMVSDTLRQGMEVEIHIYERNVIDDERVIAKINGQTTDYYKKEYPERPGERIIVVLIVLIHMLILIGMATKEYVIFGKKRGGRGWYFLSLLTAVAYGILPLISLKYPHESLWLGRYMAIATVLNLIAEAGVIWAANIDDHREEWDAMWKEDKPDEDKNGILIEQVEAEKPEALEDQELAGVEVDDAEIPPQYQFQQMGYVASEQYCRYKFRKRMRSSMEATTIIEVLDVLAAFIVAVIYEDIRRWLAIGIGGAVFLAVLAIGYLSAYRKHRRLKEAISSKEPCEYCVTEAELYGWMEFICADGHKETWKMKPDDDVKVKEGSAAVVIYLPSIHQVFTEEAKDMNQLLGLNVPVTPKKKWRDRKKTQLCSEKDRIHNKERTSQKEHETKREEERKRGEIRIVHHMIDMTKSQVQQYTENKRKKFRRSWTIMIALAAFSPVCAIILGLFIPEKYRIVLLVVICVPAVIGVALLYYILRKGLLRYQEAAEGRVQYALIEDMKFNEPMEFVDEEGNCRKKIFDSDKYTEYRGKDSVYVVYVCEMGQWYIEKQLF